MEIKRVFKAFQGFGINLRSLYFITEHIPQKKRGDMNLIQLFIQLSDVTEFILPLQLQPEASLIFTTQSSAMFDMDRVRRDLGKKSPPRVRVKGAKCTNGICDIYWHSVSVRRVYMQPQIYTLQSAASLHGGHRAGCSMNNERE